MQKNQSRSSQLAHALTPTGNKHFEVSGFAMVPVEYVMKVEASDEAQALRVAKALFENSSNVGQITPNSEDRAAVCMFDPLTAIETK